MLFCYAPERITDWHKPSRNDNYTYNDKVPFFKKMNYSKEVVIDGDYMFFGRGNTLLKMMKKVCGGTTCLENRFDKVILHSCLS